MFDISGLLSNTELLGKLLSSVKSKLLKQPDEAAAKLADVLDEVSKIFEFIEAEMCNYLSIRFLPDMSNLRECHTALLALESKSLEIRGNQARGHCHKIANLYGKYLNRWFSTLLEPQEYQDLNQLFERLGTMDDYMVQGLDSATQWLTQEAHETLNLVDELVDEGKLDAANDRVKSARKEALGVRQEMAKALSGLRALQAQFIATSGAV